MKTPAIIKSLCCTIFLFGFNVFSQNNIIPNNGNVGLGTLTPSAKLDVNGNVHIDSTLIVKDSILINKNARIKKNLIVEKDVRFIGIENITNLGNKNLLLIRPNGKLEQIEKAGFASQIGELMYTPKLCEGGNILSPVWYNGLNKIYTKCPQVNVGINNDNPRVKLDVNGFTYSTRLALGFADPLAMENNYFKMKVPVNFGTPTNIFTIQSNTTSENLFAINNLGQISAKGFIGEFRIASNLDESVIANLFMLENNQKRLIQMDNQGLLKARRIIVNQEVWPNYVFEPNYQLRSLKEVENYLLLHKHLPEVPSEKEVLENGTDLGDMDAVLLKKIEELTLYLIEQNKKIEEQALELQKIKSTLK